MPRICWNAAEKLWETKKMKAIPLLGMQEHTEEQTELNKKRTKAMASENHKKV